MLSDKENDFCIANQWSKSVSYLSSFFWIINTITDDNNSRVSYAFHSFPSSLSTKNAHKFFTFWLPSKSSHMPSCLVFFSWFWRVTTHARILWLHFSSHVPSKNALETFPSSSFSAFRMLAGSVRLSRAHLMLFLFLLVFFLVYSNLRAFQSVTICLLVCLFTLFALFFLFVLRFHQFREMLCDFKS